MQRTIVVLPCYNEAARLDADALLEATRRWPMLSFVLVDDGTGTAFGVTGLVLFLVVLEKLWPR